MGGGGAEDSWAGEVRFQGGGGARDRNLALPLQIRKKLLLAFAWVVDNPKNCVM